MTDISIVWKLDHGDWQLVGTSLLTGDDLVTALLISLFTDREVTAAELAAYGETDPRGWWADDRQGPLIGSRLWLLQRAKRTQETLQRAQDYIAEALQWMVDDGVAVRIDVACEWEGRSRLGAAVVVTRNDGSVRPMRFAWAWNEVI